jgi:PAS domain S-box-containing protein
MSPARPAGLRKAVTVAASLGRAALLAVAVLLAAGIYALAASVERIHDAPFFFLVVPIALASIAYGLKGGIGMGVLASLLTTAWWADGQPGGLVWLSSRVVTCLLIAALLGWFVESRQALARSLAQHRELSLDMIATANFDGFFTDVNPAFTRTLGFPRSELLSRPFTDFIHPDDLDPTLAAVAEQTEKGYAVLNFQNRYRTKGGSYRWLEWMSRPDPDARTLIAVARDVTDRKRVEELEHGYQQRLEAAVRDRTKELDDRNSELYEARQEMLRRLALAAEYRDDETFEHTERIRHTSALLAAELGLPDAEIELIRDAAPLHDIGKLGVSDTILLKPGKLTPEELECMRRHAATGAAILSGSSSDVLKAAEEVARCHHEWWNGTGYPTGLRGEDIPLRARIVALADVFDALTHRRPYKHAWPVDEAVAEIRRLRGLQFDPRVVDAFEQLDPYVLAGLDGAANQGQASERDRPRAA